MRLLHRHQWICLLVLAVVGVSTGRQAAEPPQKRGEAAPADPFRGPYPDDPELPPGFTDTVVATGLTGATAMAAAPDGRLFVCEQTGTLRVITGDELLSDPFVTVEVDGHWERGLIGVALDPAFPRQPYVYLCYVVRRPYVHHRISRFTAAGNRAVPGSEVILLEGDDQSKLGGFEPAGHQGGGLQFGKDGKLYIAIGEQTAGAPSQRLDTFQGKLLRINPDGSIPADNPFFEKAHGKYRAIWALGLRNPFGLAVQPGTGRMFINDVGDARLEEINDGVAGANYGWPLSEGPTSNPLHKSPLYAYGRSVGRSITGGTFYNPPVAQFPTEYVGKYFFLDFMDHWIHVLDPEHPTTASVFATGLAGPVTIVTAADGSLYYLNRKEWVKDQRFRAGTGSVHRISYAARAGPSLPYVLDQPDEPIVIAGEPVVLRVRAAGARPLQYQWFRDGRPIAGATDSAYRLDMVKKVDNGARFRCAVSNARGKTRSQVATLRVLSARPPAPAAHRVAGLDFHYYEGSWAGLPDFDSLQPVRAGSVEQLDLGQRSRDHDFGLTWRGFLHVDADGVYPVSLITTGSAKLFVASTEVVSVAGFGAPRQASGKAALQAGDHPFLLLYACGREPPQLVLRWSGPGLGPQAIPASRFLRPEPSLLSPPIIIPRGGKFTGPVSARLRSDTANVTIRYTLDGSSPSEASPAYSSPLKINRSSRLKTKSFRGSESSVEATATFEISGAASYGLPFRQLVTTLRIPQNPAELPPLLSQTGIFRSLRDLTPSPGLIPYTVNAPLWSDGADKRRWLALPGDAQITFAPTGEWKFPAGTVFVKHFEIGASESQPGPPRRLETRVLLVKDEGGYGATYRWRHDQQDAELLADGKTETIALLTPQGQRQLTWSYPSRSDCLVCHTTNAGFVLGVKTRQLNGSYTYPTTGITDNQLRTWNHLGLFESPVEETGILRLPRLAALSDGSASLEHRVRSYLDANCSQCHRPGGTRALFDARFDTPLAQQNLLAGPLAAADFGISGTRLVTPGDPSRSALCARMNRRGDVYAMPPLATHTVDIAAVAVVAEWIKRLPNR
jgi:uncharacterized repeat protein (TIGR03806 family)